MADNFTDLINGINTLLRGTDDFTPLSANIDPSSEEFTQAYQAFTQEVAERINEANTDHEWFSDDSDQFRTYYNEGLDEAAQLTDDGDLLTGAPDTWKPEVVDRLLNIAQQPMPEAIARSGNRRENNYTVADNRSELRADVQVVHDLAPYLSMIKNHDTIIATAGQEPAAETETTAPTPHTPENFQALVEQMNAFREANPTFQYASSGYRHLALDTITPDSDAFKNAYASYQEEIIGRINDLNTDHDWIGDDSEPFRTEFNTVAPYGSDLENSGPIFEGNTLFGEGTQVWDQQRIDSLLTLANEPIPSPITPIENRRGYTTNSAAIRSRSERIEELENLHDLAAQIRTIAAYEGAEVIPATIPQEPVTNGEETAAPDTATEEGGAEAPETPALTIADRIKAFQRNADMEETGELDDATKHKLGELFTARGITLANIDAPTQAEIDALQTVIEADNSIADARRRERLDIGENRETLLKDAGIPEDQIATLIEQLEGSDNISTLSSASKPAILGVLQDEEQANALLQNLWAAEQAYRNYDNDVSEIIDAEGYENINQLYAAYDILNFNKDGTVANSMQAAVSSQITTPETPSGIDYNAIPEDVKQRIRDFQRNVGIPETGELDEITQQKIAAFMEKEQITLDGNSILTPGQDAVDALRELMEDDNTIENARAYERLEFTNQQKERLQQLGFSSEETDSLIDDINNSASGEALTTALHDRIQNKTGNEEQTTQIINDLWMIESAQRNYNGDVSEIIDAEGYEDLNQLYALYDIANYFQNGEINNSLRDEAQIRYTHEEILAIDDRFFDAEVYEQLQNPGQVDGALIGREPGIMYDRDDVAKIAFDIFVQRAEDQGIAMQDVSRAMLEGRFNPWVEDLQLVRDGLGRPTGEEILNNPTYQTYVQDWVNAGYITQGSPDSMAHQIDNLGDAQIAAVITLHQNDKWNQTFGDIKDLGTVNTITHGQEMAMTQEAMGLRLLMRRMPEVDFEQRYGMGYDEAAQKLNTDPTSVPAELRQEALHAVDLSTGINFVLSGYSDDQPDEKTILADYQALRERYREGMEESGVTPDSPARDQQPAAAAPGQ